MPTPLRQKIQKVKEENVYLIILASQKGKLPLSCSLVSKDHLEGLC